MEGDNYKGPNEGVRSDFFYAHSSVHNNTIAGAHRSALYEIIWNRNNNKSVTEDGEAVLQCGPRTYVVKDITKDRFWDVLPFSERFLDEYTNALMNGYRAGVKFEYDYHSRLYDHFQDHDLPGVNQIQEIIDKLIENPNSRRAVAITWYPGIDLFVKDCPCLQYIQFVVIDDTLHMNVLFRSNDMLSAFGNNAYALSALMKYVCDYISRSINKKLKYGYYNHTSVCPHIYYKRDAAEYQKVIDYFHKEGMI